MAGPKRQATGGNWRRSMLTRGRCAHYATASCNQRLRTPAAIDPGIATDNLPRKTKNTAAGAVMGFQHQKTGVFACFMNFIDACIGSAFVRTGIVLVLALALGACAYNPKTGQLRLTGPDGVK